MTRRTLGLSVLVVLGLAAVAWAQGAGGAFVPSFAYVVTGQWTWARSSPPIVFKTTPTSAFGTSLGFTTPTANRTITFPDATGTVQLGTGAGKFASGNSVKTSNPLSITTGLATLTNCSATPVSTSDTLAVMVSLQLTVSAGRLDIYSWKTSGAAQTTSTLFTWGCSGT